MKPIFEVVLAAAVLALAPSLAHAETATTEVEGVAAVVNGDLAAARDRAIDDAKRKAVEQVAGASVSAESIVENFQLVEERIYSRASGFVKTYQIASEHQQEGVYHVRIRATVDKSAVADDLSLIMKTKPRVIVLVAEQNVGSKDFSYWWGNEAMTSDMDIFQTALISDWQPRGYKFIDPGLLAGKLKAEGALRQAGLTNEAAVALSRDADADIAIVGKVLVTDAGPMMDGVKMNSFHAVGTVRVLNVDTGEIIAVADDTGVGRYIEGNTGGRMAIKALAKKLGESLEKKVLTKWTSEATNAREVELVVTGVANTKMLNELVRVIKEEARGVEAVHVRRRSKGEAKITVRVRARASELAEDLENKTYKDFSVEVEGVTRAQVELALEK